MKTRLGSNSVSVFEHYILPNNFCAYWRMTFLHFLLAAFLTCGAGILLGMLAVTAYNTPIQFGIVTGIVILIISTIIGLIALTHYLSDAAENRRVYKEKNNIPDGIVVTKYKSWKSKICPRVEYK
jgi:hypothetical protein